MPATRQSGAAGGRLATTAGGRRPATIGPVTPPEPPAPRVTHAAAAGGRLATTAGGRSPAIIGGPGAVPASVGRLLDVPGYAMVLTRNGDRRRFAASAGSAGLTALTAISQVNAAGAFKASLPADGGELFRWAYSDVVIGHDGDRLFHGTLVPVEAQSASSVDVSGYGRLYELTVGDMAFSCSNTDGYGALNDFWAQVGERTDGRIRGYCERPPTGTRQTIGDEPFEASGSPMEVAQRLHGEFGYSFVLDPADTAAVVASFRPGTQTRSASWIPIGDPQPKIDPTGYANDVIVRGAERDDGTRPEGRARASAEEAEQLTGGYLPPLAITNDDLTSTEACQSAAVSKLDEARGKYSLTGTRDVTPTAVTPGYVYEVPSFNSGVPEAARPATAIPQKVTHTLIGDEAKTELDFSEPSGIVAQLQRQRNPDLAPGGVQRQQSGIVAGMTADDPEDVPPVFAAEYPHQYP